MLTSPDAPAFHPIRSRLLPRRCARGGLGLAAFCVVAAGCIERTVSIRTEPDDARVYLNDQEVGRTPLTVQFTWYGDYDIVIRKPGYETLHTHYVMMPPWYDVPVLDLFTECLLPINIRDHREPPIFALEKARTPDKDEVVGRAEEMRERALFKAD